MLIKGRISKKLTGAICIPTISQQAMTANMPFEIDEKQFWAPDIQRALQMKKIVFTSKTPEQSDRVVLTNISIGSVSIPGYGVVRSANSIRIPKEDAKKADVQRLLEDGKISVDGKKKEAKKQKLRSGVIVMGKRVPARKNKNWNPITCTPTSDDNSSIIDTESKDDSDGIDWVDVDNLERLKSHPILGKKNGKNSNSKSGKAKEK